MAVHDLCVSRRVLLWLYHFRCCEHASIPGIASTAGTPPPQKKQKHPPLNMTVITASLASHELLILNPPYQTRGSAYSLPDHILTVRFYLALSKQPAERIMVNRMAFGSSHVYIDTLITA